MLQRCVDGDEALDGAIHQQPWVFLDQIGFPAVAGGEVEVTLFHQHLFDAVHDQHRVAVAQLRHEHADGEALLAA